MPLFTAVPSRSFFPRGFLWDEGFHQLVVRAHAPAAAADALAHWLDLVDGDGWVAREQILGAEARKRVPPEFVAQARDVANPPTLLLLLEKLLADAGPPGGQGPGSDVVLHAVLPRLLPRAERWFGWLLRTQSAAGDGDPRGGFYWRGRDPSDPRLNALTLASGLDDYPRATVPGPEERHADLAAWLAFGARVLAGAAHRFPGVLAKGAPHYEALGADLWAALESRHWDEASGAYLDWGVTAGEGSFVDLVVFKCASRDGGSQVEAAAPLETARRGRGCPAAHPKFLFPLGDGKGGLLTRQAFKARGPPREGFVARLGYASLFPLLLRLLPADSPRLGRLLDRLADPALLWTDHGLRSLSAQDPFYMRDNAPGDAPYWRGPVWININYLALWGLRHYAQQPGPHAERAALLYAQLRTNVVRAVHGEYQRTGFMYEQYNQDTGRGQRTHPFNGWTALVALIIAEIF